MTFARPRLLGLALALLLATFAPRARADVPISEEARSHFAAGVNLLQDPGGARYEDAYLEFKAAYTASPSPRILGNLGLCAMKLERDQEAIDAYERYLAEVKDLEKDERAQINSDLQTLKTGVVRLSLRVNVAGAVLVDVRTPAQGAPVSNTYGPVQGTIELGVRSGRHALTVKAAGYEPATWEIDAPPGTSQAHDVELKKPAPPPPKETPAPRMEQTRPLPVLVLVTAGASLALAAGGAVTGVLALEKRTEFDKVNDGRQPDSARSVKAAGEALDVTADVLFATALVGAGVTTYLYLTRPTVPRPHSGAAALRFHAGASPAGAAVGLSGVF
ncbi:tetratricopeptide repeat protein [Sorangium sp. So ce726]|uniref:tetratricopeptide repeat protein n=1 Tax=Sorangium sp. So ce726 TaxID=3133319 RepID=UPI003F5F0F37